MVTEFPVALPFVEMIGEYADDKIKPLVTVNDDNVPDPTIRSKLSVVMTVPSTFGIVIVRSCVGSTIAILYKADEDGIVNLNAAAFCIVPTNVVDPPKLVAPLKTPSPLKVIDPTVPIWTISARFPVVIMFPLASAGKTISFTPLFGSTNVKVVLAVLLALPSKSKGPLILPVIVKRSLVASPIATFPFKVEAPETVNALPEAIVPKDAIDAKLPFVIIVPVVAGHTTLHADDADSNVNDVFFVSLLALLNLSGVANRILDFITVVSASAFPRFKSPVTSTVPDTVNVVKLGKSVRSFVLPSVIMVPPVFGNVIVLSVDVATAARYVT